MSPSSPDDRQAPRPGRAARAASRPRTERARRGRLKIFFGAAPGVGKTSRMLEAARAQRRARASTWWSGSSETHGRAETAALLEGLEVLPRRSARLPRRRASRSSTSTRRSPASPRCSWSTSSPTPTRPARATPSAGRTSRSCSPPASTSTPPLNVQHLESLNDVVAQITGRQGARDGARLGARARRRGRAGRPAARRAPAAAPGGQGLRPRAGAARAIEQLLPQGQPDRAARAGAAPHRRARGRADARLHGRAGHPRDLGDRRAAAGLHRAEPRAPCGWSGPRGAWRRGCTPMVRGVRRDPARPAADARPSGRTSSRAWSSPSSSAAGRSR